jgi:hypothetical protein
MKNEMIESVHVILIYLNNDFVGYVKDYRIYRNKKYRFNKTKNINIASKFIFKDKCEDACNKLNNLRDVIYTKSYNFKCGIITNQEIRRSKLSVLKIIIIREGIFKNKII